MEWTLLSTLSAEDQRSVIAATHRRKFRRDEVIFHEGDAGDSYHLIAKGKVAIQISTANGDLATLNVLGPSDGFGELALVGSNPRRSATVRALEAVETMVLNRNDFDDLCRRQPTVQRLLVEVLAQQVRRLSGQVLDALYVPAETRVIRRLRDLSALYDRGDERIVIPITQEELASMAGTTRPTTNRALQDLVAAGIAELGRGRTEVLDLDALDRRAR